MNAGRSRLDLLERCCFYDVCEEHRQAADEPLPPWSHNFSWVLGQPHLCFVFYFPALTRKG